MKPYCVILVFMPFLFFAKCQELFVDEAGESDFIPIDTEDHFNTRSKRQALNQDYTDDYSDYNDNFESSGSSDYYDTEDDDSTDTSDPYYDVTPVMPTRVVPTLVSPSFEDPGSFGNVMMSKSPVLGGGPASALDVLKTAVVFDEDDTEGSGDDFDPLMTIIAPTKTMLEPMITPTIESSTPVITTTQFMNNQPPVVSKKLKKHAVVAGRALRIQIPEDTFYDSYDGNTRQMRVDIQQENGTPLRVPWLKYDPQIQTIFALPFDENGIGRYTFNVVATNSRGLSVQDKLEIVVRQYSGARLVNHQFNIEFSFANWRPEATKGWEWHMLDKLKELYETPLGSDHILIRNIGENPFVFSWTNDSLTQQTCPQSEIRRLFAKLVEGEDTAYKSKFGMASSQLKDLLGNEILVKSVSMSYLGTCLRDDTIAKNSNINNSGQEDSVPQIRNPIDRINITAGELLRFKVPEDTCFDQEDGKTSQLNLHLLTTNRRELSPDAWLQFISKNQEFVGIPLEEEVGREEYQLVCSDANGLSAIDGIEVIVLNRPFNERFGVEFSLQFEHGNGMDSGMNFGQPILRRDSKVHIVESLAKYFGDASTSNIILRVFDADNGRVVWHNKSLAQQPCDSQQVFWVKNQLINREGKVVKALVRHFQPYLKLVDADAIKVGHCLTGAVPAVPTHGTPNSNDGRGSSGGGNAIFHGMIPSADYLLTFIIPAVIITCMLILAILLACMLHKKRKAGKLNLFYSEALPPRVPVILQDELFEEQDMAALGGNNKQPVLLREDLNGGHQRGGSLMRNPAENESLLMNQRPIQIDPYGRGSLGRPTPAYQRRQL